MGRPHDEWPQSMARWFREVEGPRAVRLIVMHTMEAPEKGDTAESVARYFATTDVKASAHVCVDNNSIVQCVDDNDVAYGAPGANNDGLHVEMAGSFRQTAEQWDDEYSRGVLAKAAEAVAQFCVQHDIPPLHLSNDALLAGERGIVGHSQVSAAYRKEAKPDEHRDPGEAFPWGHFLDLVTIAIADRNTD